MLVKIAIKNSENEENNVRIGDTLLTMFLSDPIVNYHIGTLIYEIAKKAVDD